jgi:glycosyltransferase involved in cell wall biosynthesis
VFPSLWQEPFGIPLLEAMACEIAVVATRGGAFPEIVEDGRSGLLVPRDDPRALAAALGRLLDDEPERRALAGEGRRRVVRAFSWEHVVERLQVLYASLLRRA